MEINSKQLHLHAMPVALLLLGFVSLLSLTIGQPSPYGKELFTSAFNIKHKANGLTSLDLKDSSTVMIGDSQTSELGQTAQLYLMFNVK